MYTYRLTILDSGWVHERTDGWTHMHTHTHTHTPQCIYNGLPSKVMETNEFLQNFNVELLPAPASEEKRGHMTWLGRHMTIT